MTRAQKSPVGHSHHSVGAGPELAVDLTENQEPHPSPTNVAEYDKSAMFDEQAADADISKDEDAVEVIGSSGPNVLSDFPHARADCAVHHWTLQGDHASKLKHCSNCYCYICDGPASDCRNWDEHCEATSKVREWRLKRQSQKSDRQAEASRIQLSEVRAAAQQRYRDSRSSSRRPVSSGIRKATPTVVTPLKQQLPPSDDPNPQSTAQNDQEVIARAEFDKLRRNTNTSTIRYCRSYELLTPGDAHLNAKAWSSFFNFVKDAYPGWSVKRRLATDAEKERYNCTMVKKAYFISAEYSTARLKNYYKKQKQQQQATSGVLAGSQK